MTNSKFSKYYKDYIRMLFGYCCHGRPQIHNFQMFCTLTLWGYLHVSSMGECNGRGKCTDTVQGPYPNVVPRSILLQTLLMILLFQITQRGQGGALSREAMCLPSQKRQHVISWSACMLRSYICVLRSSPQLFLLHKGAQTPPTHLYPGQCVTDPV